jgi:DNA-binding transcriptional MocR family regulator
MLWSIVSYVWEKAQVRETELLLLLAIAHHTNKEGKAYPSINRLARYIRRTPRTVKRLIRELEAQGYLTVAYQAGPKGTNVFHICTPVQDDTALSPGVTIATTLLGDTAMTPKQGTSISQESLKWLNPCGKAYRELVGGMNGTGHKGG